MKAALVILNYQGKELLEKYLPSVLKYTPKQIPIYIADNGSTDDSISFVSNHYPNVKILALKQNKGFAAGYNTALQQIDAEYYILINSDIRMSEDWISPIVEFMDKESDIACTQPKIRSDRNPDYFEHAGAAGGWLDTLGYPFCKGRIFDTVEIDNDQYNKIYPCFWASGAAMVVRSTAFHRAGGFDEDFFAHMEEIDLCFRFQKMGLKVMAFNTVKVFHLGAGTLAYDSPFKVYLNFRNSLLMILKNMPIHKTLWLIPTRLILDGVAGIRFLIQGNFDALKAVIKAHFSFYKLMGAAWKKRTFISSISQVDAHPKSGVYKGSIVWQYYILGNKQFQFLGGRVKI